MSIRPQQFQKLLLSWFDRHGRKHLPWQKNKTPYRVWISEIMLQQTQVATVIPYYEQFMQHYPDLSSLAMANEDDVLHLWAGLGYYSRARNLLRAARMIIRDFAGKLPNNAEQLRQLPGIGESTAGAILSIAFNQPAAILDGNVKRVLARLHAVTQPVNDKKIETRLWELAKSYTPSRRTADYTQAIMDLGATLCTRSKPQCAACPLASHCAAHQLGIADQLPKKKSARKLPIRTSTFIILEYNGKLLLNKRPSSGIWGGLWSFPEIPGAPDLSLLRAFCRKHYQINVTTCRELESFRHTFSHYHLDIQPVVIPIRRKPAKIMEGAGQIWYNPSQPEAIGLPKPVQTIIGHWENCDDTTNTLHEAAKRSRRIGTTAASRRNGEKNL